MQDQAQRRSGRIVLALLASILFLATLLVAVEPLYGKQTVEATVTLADAPRTCRGRLLRLAFKPYRSSAPIHTGWIYCGLVLTDYGAFVLPESGLFTAGSGPREAFVDALKPGCRYRLTVAGFGQTLAPGKAPASHGHKTLTALTPLGPCA